MLLKFGGLGNDGHLEHGCTKWKVQLHGGSKPQLIFIVSV